MRTQESLEDYLETILLLGEKTANVHQIDIARRLNISQPAVTKAVGKLKEAGYVRSEGMHIFLTDAGRERAAAVYARHCDIRAFLLALGVDAADADRDACKIEHVIGDATYAAIKNYLQKDRI